MADNIQVARKNIEDLKLEAERAERLGDYGKVAEIRYGKIKEEEAKLAELEKQFTDQDAKMIKEEVDRKTLPKW